MSIRLAALLALLSLALSLAACGGDDIVLPGADSNATPTPAATAAPTPAA